MALFAWSSGLGPFERLRDEMNRLFERRFFGWGVLPDWFERRGRFPRLNMSETADALTVRCEVPGVAREDIETSIEGGVLTIRGTRKTPEDRLEERYHGRGRFVGPFERTLELPARVDVDNVKAKLTDGVLEITMPKHPDSRPKRIEVKLG